MATRTRRLEDRAQLRIVWTETERRALANKAAALQADDPSMAGLPLLREAMKILPSDRRRRVQSMLQIPWWDRELASAVQSKVAPDCGVYHPILSESLDTTKRHVDLMAEVIGFQREILEELREIKKQISKLSTKS